MKEGSSDRLHPMVELEREALASDEEAIDYLLASVFYRAMDTLRAARVENGLTQQDVAGELATTQSVIARMENAHRGDFSFDRFLRYAAACKVIPLDLDFRPIEAVREYARLDPTARRTTTAFDAWSLRSREQASDRQFAASPASDQDSAVSAASIAINCDSFPEFVAESNNRGNSQLAFGNVFGKQAGAYRLTYRGATAAALRQPTAMSGQSRMSQESLTMPDVCDQQVRSAHFPRFGSLSNQPNAAPGAQTVAA